MVASNGYGCGSQRAGLRTGIEPEMSNMGLILFYSVSETACLHSENTVRSLIWSDASK